MLETTPNLLENEELATILETLVRKLCEYDTIAPAAVKGYYRPVTTWTMGEGATPGFAHVTLAILAGRPAELRTRMADGLYAEMKRLFTRSLESGETGVTLELREMDAATYRK